MAQADVCSICANPARPRSPRSMARTRWQHSPSQPPLAVQRGRVESYRPDSAAASAPPDRQQGTQARSCAQPRCISRMCRVACRGSFGSHTLRSQAALRVTLCTGALWDIPLSRSTIPTPAVFPVGVSTGLSRSVSHILALHLPANCALRAYSITFLGTRGDSWGHLWDSSPHLTNFPSPSTIGPWQGVPSS
jgi:hypothetical protein